MYDPDAELLLAEIRRRIHLLHRSLELRKMLVQQSTELMNSVEATRQRVLGRFPPAKPSPKPNSRRSA